jgi:hypothetical protein
MGAGTGTGTSAGENAPFCLPRLGRRLASLHWRAEKSARGREHARPAPDCKHVVQQAKGPAPHHACFPELVLTEEPVLGQQTGRGATLGDIAPGMSSPNQAPDRSF